MPAVVSLSRLNYLEPLLVSGAAATAGGFVTEECSRIREDEPPNRLQHRAGGHTAHTARSNEPFSRGRNEVGLNCGETVALSRNIRQFHPYPFGNFCEPVESGTAQPLLCEMDHRV